MVRAVHKEHVASKFDSLDGVAILSGVAIPFESVMLLQTSKWTHLMFLPNFQKNAVGSALVRHGFENLAADEVPLWIVTQMRGQAMSLKFGFQDLNVIYVVLRAYVGPWRGFGIH